jgi:hypothetical protein
MEYDDQMDQECIDLCNAINEIPGLETVSSCCGHGKHDMWIWLKAATPRDLYLLSRCIDKRYCGYLCHWTLEVSSDDQLEGDPVSFWLRSRTKGHAAYGEAKRLAREIRDCFDHENLMRLFYGSNTTD